jgi:hypothetical protein
MMPACLGCRPCARDRAALMDCTADIATSRSHQRFRVSHRDLVCADAAAVIIGAGSEYRRLAHRIAPNRLASGSLWSAAYRASGCGRSCKPPVAVKPESRSARRYILAGCNEPVGVPHRASRLKARNPHGTRSCPRRNTLTNVRGIHSFGVAIGRNLWPQF